MNRPATVKLTRAEWTSLILAVVLELGIDTAKTILRNALGEERANLLIEQQSGPRLSKEDNRAIIRELYPHAPGETREEKIEWAIATGVSVFGNTDRFAEILAYVQHRVELYDDGSIG
jgi:hypothetical protein